MAHRNNNGTHLVPKTNVPRPSLPYAHSNPFLSMVENYKLPAVKYQIITREGQEIVVGRVKIQTPNSGHAFVLRRFDTGAISLTTMFRAAFPTANEEAEKIEAAWVKANYDSRDTNGSSKDLSARLRLAGTWVTAEVAKAIAPSYSLEHIITPLANTQPDSQNDYRRSTKPASPQTTVKPAIKPENAPPPPYSASQSEPNPSKRRKESSPLPVATSAPAPLVDLRPSTSSTTRRGGRTTASPAPSSRSSRVKPPSKRVQQQRPAATTTVANGKEPSRYFTPAESDHVPDGDVDIAEVPGPDMSEDIAEQKELIAKLKAEREHDALKRAAQVEMEASGSGTIMEVEESPAEASGSAGSQIAKREREEDKPLQFEFREPVTSMDGALVPRPVVSNSRLRLPTLEPQQKSAAWGAVWFGVGLAAAATIPSLFM